MRNNPSPCYGCTERHTACHDHCERYAQWKAADRKRKEAEKEYKLRQREDYLRSELCQAAKDSYIKSKRKIEGR